MGKRKYRQVYRNVSFQKFKKNRKKYRKRLTVSSCPIPLLVPYNKLMPFIKSIDIGTIHNTSELSTDVQDSDEIQGCYRDLKELLVMLAEFYLAHRSDELVWFDEPNKFYIALGGDGAPFGKYDTACAWLVSILNLGKGVLSSHDNYLLFGANCSESCSTVGRFIQKLMLDIGKIEKQSFPVRVKETEVIVKFCISELPNDMKMLAYLAGELPNSAKYFLFLLGTARTRVALLERRNRTPGNLGSTAKDWLWRGKLRLKRKRLRSKVSSKQQSATKSLLLLLSKGVVRSLCL